MTYAEPRFHLNTAQGVTFCAYRVILATGTKYRTLGGQIGPRISCRLVKPTLTRLLALIFLVVGSTTLGTLVSNVR